MATSKLPEEMQALLPSSPISNLDPQKDKNYIIENLLHNATLNAWRWMYKSYAKNDILNVITKSRSLNRRDVTFWSNIYNIPQGSISCLQTDSQTKQKTFWPY